MWSVPNIVSSKSRTVQYRVPRCPGQYRNVQYRVPRCPSQYRNVQVLRCLGFKKTPALVCVCAWMSFIGRRRRRSEKGSAKPYRSAYFYSSIKWKKCIFHNQMFTYIHVVVFVFVLPEVIKLLKCYFQSVISVQQSFYFLKIKTIVLSFSNKTYIYSLIHIIIPATIYFFKA